MEQSSLFVLIATLLITIWYDRLFRRIPLSLPPGPQRLPIVGNLFNRPVRMTWLVYEHWAQKYGDVFSMEILGQPVIVVNSAKAAYELFEKRSSNYADRPPFHMANDLRKWYWDFAHMRYTDDWRLHRKTFHQYFQSSKAVGFQSVQLNATITLLRELLASPEDFRSHVRHHTGKIILRVTYGYSAQAGNDSYVELADRALRGLVYALIPGSYVVDYIPIFKCVPAWFPFGSFQTEAAIAADNALALRDGPFQLLMDDIAQGTALPSFVTSSLDRMKRAGMDETTAKRVTRNCAGVSFAAGADTTVTAVLSMILAMMHYPEIQKRAHAELDAVVGRKRLPTFEDRDRLPFINAILAETLRWRPVTPLAIAHASVSDDVYEDYLIPGGSIVFGNAWAILHDETIYPDASTFDPDRFLGADPAPHPSNMGGFGFGRRICPGRYLAMNSMFIAMASILWGFEISMARDGKGEEITPDVMAYSDGVISHPLPFKCKIVSRFEEVATVLETAESVPDA